MIAVLYQNGLHIYFGIMKSARLRRPLESGRPVRYQSNGNKVVAPFHPGPTLFNALLAPSTPHSFSDSQAAWKQGKSGFWTK